MSGIDLLDSKQLAEFARMKPREIKADAQKTVAHAQKSCTKMSGIALLQENLCTLTASDSMSAECDRVESTKLK